MEIRGRLFKGESHSDPVGEEVRVYDTYHLEPITRTLSDSWGVWSCLVPDDPQLPLFAVVRQGECVPFGVVRQKDL